MIPELQTTRVFEDQVAAKKSKYNRLFWLILRRIIVFVAGWGFIAFISVDLYGGKLGMTALTVFALAMLALKVMPWEPATPLPAVEGENSVKAMGYRLPDWSLLAFGVIFSIGCTGECVFLWFGRRYDPLSIQVACATALIMALYAAIGIVVAYLATKNWRTAILVFAFVPGAMAGIVLRLHLLR